MVSKVCLVDNWERALGEVLFNSPCSSGLKPWDEPLTPVPYNHWASVLVEGRGYGAAFRLLYPQPPGLWLTLCFAIQSTTFFLHCATRNCGNRNEKVIED